MRTGRTLTEPSLLVCIGKCGSHIDNYDTAGHSRVLDHMRDTLRPLMRLPADAHIQRRLLPLRPPFLQLTSSSRPPFPLSPFTLIPTGHISYWVPHTPLLILHSLRLSRHEAHNPLPADGLRRASSSPRRGCSRCRHNPHHDPYHHRCWEDEDEDRSRDHDCPYHKD